MDALFRQGEREFGASDVLAALRRLGVKQGDTICVHSELISFGALLVKKEKFLSQIVGALKSAVGESGTIIIPTFTYSFCKNEPYDMLNSRSTVGVLGEYFRKLSGVSRTRDPIFSFAVSGAKKEMFLMPSKTCLGKGSVYDVLAQVGGKILILGTMEKGFTFTHYVEEEAGVSYRFYKEFKGEIIDEARRVGVWSVLYYVRHLDRPSEADLNKQIELLKQSDNFLVENVGNAPIVLIDAARYKDKFLSAIRADEMAIIATKE
ncbi:AAC(3) family N-acetyltransferase [Campylobacter sp. 19-13652]|uniref:AAC(3) family N-acetyltransferase n=1 Tax=Campylobacter sp. 19-13652 TaxID=2840180 RepID=UPI001C751708|nr:AAC(3) family N-acetyltransferase [Campylobacter sp. 19-13652]BCX79027.1 N-acetyltransferase [Campylobacter sp. 19-13652]